MEDLDPEKLFLVFKDALAAWDNYAMAALKHGSASSASECAVFANELLKERRKTFLIGDDE